MASLVPASPTATTVPPSRVPGPHVYEGSVAGKPVLVRLHCDSKACSGTYFYQAIGEALELVQQGDGFDERVGIGTFARVTGHLSFASPPGGSTWTGTWTAASAASAPIALTRIAAGRPRSFRRTFSDRIGRSCRVLVRSVELVGLADPALEERLDALLSPEHQALEHAAPYTAPAGDSCGDSGKQCDVSAKGYRLLCRDHSGREGLYLEKTVQITLLDERLVSLRSEYDFDGGGMHPSDGVVGVTIDLRTGVRLDARDLLRDAGEEPPYHQLTVRKKVADPELDAHGMPLAIGQREDDRESRVDLGWMDFYLTPTTLELVPIVAEAARIFRHDVQSVPLTRLRRFWNSEGPAGYLLPPASKRTAR